MLGKDAPVFVSEVTLEDFEGTLKWLGEHPDARLASVPAFSGNPRVAVLRPKQANTPAVPCLTVFDTLASVKKFLGEALADARPTSATRPRGLVSNALHPGHGRAPPRALLHVLAVLRRRVQVLQHERQLRQGFRGLGVASLRTTL